ncbi:hypothetical protein GCM10011505_26700 [Tistrella bauzanensis]|uniref:Uncharacterized protein n=1 Tax=Tistrella bauzanensis TaxID=657419 RepID=A0ABQ1IJS3_9PROT|nr:DUF6880 family protein [Tistrella bauzanensis]GGB44039.1 hypothetical protein GCM10011505_26700 [Tistrella bauzanensis]
MASKTTLNARNLEALGAARLAALLIEVSTGNAAAKRRIRLALAGADSPLAVAHEVRKRLIAIGASKGRVSWRRRKALVEDLDTQRRAIAGPLAATDPAEAMDLIWRFLALAGPVLARSTDTSGAVTAVFQAASADLPAIARAARADPLALADRAATALAANDQGQYDGLAAALVPLLGASTGDGSPGLDRLRQRLSRLPGPAPRQALQAIADCLGDVDGFIGQIDPAARALPTIAARIAQRLLAAGRVAEAAASLHAVRPDHRPRLSHSRTDLDWEDAQIAVLEAQGRGSAAQALRLACFEQALSAPHLKAYLKRLPDFDDIEARDLALDLATRHPAATLALHVLVSWPDLERAAALVMQRGAALDTDRHDLLGPAAQALAGRYPLAATLIWRAMIDDTLTRRRAGRYRMAARWLDECRGVAGTIGDVGAAVSHDDYLEQLRRDHARKAAFWRHLS